MAYDWDGKRTRRMNMFQGIAIGAVIVNRLHIFSSSHRSVGSIDVADVCGRAKVKWPT
jgi:hypothetical protein